MNMLIVANGAPPSAKLFTKRYKQADYVIAADGGLAVFGDAAPNLIVGDMDSAGKASLEKYRRMGSELLVAPVEKNETDSMLALDEAIRRGAKRITMLGATGMRLDHTLSNLAMLKRAMQKGVALTIEDDEQVITIGRGEFDITGKKGQTVSILPMNASAHVTATGLYYPLENLLLANNKARGVSNVFLGGSAHISTKQPVILIKIKNKG